MSDSLESVCERNHDIAIESRGERRVRNNNGARRVVEAVLLRALRDAAGERNVEMRSDALAWILSDDCQDWCDMLGMDWRKVVEGCQSVGGELVK